MSEPGAIAIVLAAGKGTRMRSAAPKVLHPLGGRPIIRHVLDTARAAGIAEAVVVVGHEGGRVAAAAGPGAVIARQEEQRGTGHAVLQAREAAAGSAIVVVLNGDVPLVTPDSLRALIARHAAARAVLTFATCEPGDPGALGRVVRAADGRVAAIVEAAGADAAVLALREVNAGVYCFDGAWLWPRLDALTPSAGGGELYLTDLVAAAVAEGATVETITLADPDEGLGINDRHDLAVAERVLRQRVVRRLMLDDGVTIVDPERTYVEATVRVGRDTILEPNTHLRGETTVGANCVVGPDTVLRNARIGDGCRVVASTIEDSELEAEVDVGPYSHLRGGAHVERGVHIGNYVEIKGSRIGRDTKLGHFCYVGDAELGPDVNIGAGAVTANYDGERKHRTIVGEGAFIGSDTMLVAPVRVGAGARTGAGSVVTRDVPDGATVFGVPARTREEADDGR